MRNIKPSGVNNAQIDYLFLNYTYCNRVVKNFIIFIAILSFLGCETDDKGNDKSGIFIFEVKNLTSKKFTLFLYNPDNPLLGIKDSLFKKIVIKSLDSAIVEEAIIYPAPLGGRYSLTQHLDSAIILFEDGKKLTQTYFERGNNDTIKNVLSSLFYFNVNSKQRFTLKESDYFRAQ